MLSKKKSAFRIICLALIILDILLYNAIEFFDYLNQFKFELNILLQKIIEIIYIKLTYFSLA